MNSNTPDDLDMITITYDKFVSREKQKNLSDRELYLVG